MTEQLKGSLSRPQVLPGPLLTAMSFYSKRMAMMGNAERVGPEAFYQLLRQPCAGWFPEGSELFTEDACLVEGDRLGDVAAELNLNGTDIQVTLTEGIMKQHLDACRDLAEREPAEAQASYEAFRSLVCTRPVMTPGGLIDAQSNGLLPVELVQRTWAVEGEPEPDGHVTLCGACGYPLTRTRSGYRCHSFICSDRTDRFVKVTTIRHEPGMRCLTVGMAKCVAAPGKPELALFHWLRDEQGMATELWPGVDAYDLLVRADKRLAVDVKDHGNPGLLAVSLTPFRQSPAWDEAFIVVPDDRVARVPGYLKILERLAPPDVRAQGVRFLSVSGFKSVVIERRRG